MQDEVLFEDRTDAGKKLSKYLQKYSKDNPILFALPRGGVVIGYEVAKELEQPLYPFISRKISAPGDPEFGIGAVAEGDVLILNTEIVEQYKIPSEDVDRMAALELQEMEKRISVYRNNQSLPDVRGKTVIILDDGLATGVTAHAAITSIQNMIPDKLIFAAPVCSYYSGQVLSEFVHEMHCIIRPFDLFSVGAYYRKFDIVTDDKVAQLLTEIKSIYG